jgi:hypothetical protein
VGRLIGRYNLASIAVVDSAGVLLGRITFDDVIDVIEAEQTEDIFLMAGVGGDESALRYTWIESVRARVPWLFVNLLTAARRRRRLHVLGDDRERRDPRRDHADRGGARRERRHAGARRDGAHHRSRRGRGAGP